MPERYSSDISSGGGHPPTRSIPKGQLILFIIFSPPTKRTPFLAVRFSFSKILYKEVAIMATDKNILRAAEAAEILGVATSSVYHLCRGNQIPHLRIGGAIRFRKSTLERFLDQQEARTLGLLNK